MTQLSSMQYTRIVSAILSDGVYIRPSVTADGRENVGAHYVTSDVAANDV